MMGTRSERQYPESGAWVTADVLLREHTNDEEDDEDEDEEDEDNEDGDEEADDDLPDGYSE